MTDNYREILQQAALDKTTSLDFYDAECEAPRGTTFPPQNKRDELFTHPLCLRVFAVQSFSGLLTRLAEVLAHQHQVHQIDEPVTVQVGFAGCGRHLYSVIRTDETGIRQINHAVPVDIAG